MTQTLLDISDDMVALNDLICESDGDVSSWENTLDEWITDLKTNMSGKVDNYAALITMIQGRIKFRQEEAERLKARALTDENAVVFLKKRLLDAFKLHQIGKLETDRFRVSLAKNGGLLPLLIANPNLVPKDYVRTLTTESVDKEKVRQALTNGQKVEGCELLERGEHINIK